MENNNNPDIDNKNNDSKLNETADLSSNTTQTPPITTENSSEIIPPTKKKQFSFPKISLNKNTVLAGSLALLLLVVGTASLLLTRQNTDNSSQNEVVATNDESEKLGVAILIAEGTLQTKSIDNGEWKDADTNTQISEGISLRTVGATSRAVIAFDDGSALRLDANSEAELETVTVDRIVIKHISGYTYNRVLPSEKLKYVVSSTDAQYEALGTAFKTASTGDEQSVEVYHSKVVETGLNKTPEAGEKLTVINKSKPTENGNIEKLDIEQVKSDAFLQWNRELDEKDENYKANLGFLSDIIGPEITLNSKDGDVVLLEPNAVEGTIEISGNTESGARVTAQSKSKTGSAPVDVTVGSDGKFTTPVLSAPLGDAVFEFVAKDRTGNMTAKTVRITFQRKSQPVAGNAVSFVLSSSISADKLQLNWKLSGIEAPDGFKVVYEKDNQNPIFNQGNSKSFPTKEISGSIKLDEFKAAGAYYVKICIYDSASSTCGQYSNSIKYEKT